jgi:hypothetical protein
MERVDRAILWPLSNWLWTNIVNLLLTGLARLTPRRMIYLLFFMACVFSFAQIFSADLAMMLAGDSALYLEIATFAYVAVVRNRLDRALALVAQVVRHVLYRSGQAIARVAARAKRPLRQPRLFDNDDAGDVPDGAPIFTYAFA